MKHTQYMENVSCRYKNLIQVHCEEVETVNKEEKEGNTKEI